MSDPSRQLVSSQRVLLVGWAGADWSVIHPLLDAGQLPHLESVVNAGVMGQIASVQPQVAPLVWNSIATGLRAEHHGVVGYLRNKERYLEPVHGGQRTGKPFWEICSDAGLRTHVLNWPTYPAEAINGTFITDLFSRFGDAVDSSYRQLPRAVSPGGIGVELEELRIDPRELGHEELLPFVPQAAAVNQNRDLRLAILAGRLAESATAHAMATAVLEDDWQVAAVCYDLIDRLSHTFMPFHPPRLAAVSSAEFDLYRGVMNRVYCFCDQMLGRLLEFAGPDATVMLFSDHGFRTADDRPPHRSKGRGDGSWHRQMGVLAMRGPAFRQDEYIWGGRLIDICPTMMAVLGLPHRGMDGMPLKGAFRSECRISDADSSAEAKKTPEIAPPSKEEGQILRQHLLNDGYLQEEHFTNPQSATMAEDACDFNLAQCYLQIGKVDEALELLERCQARRPEVPRFAIQVAQCRLALGDMTGCREMVERAITLGIPSWYGAKLLGQVLVAEGKSEAALEQLFLSERQQPRQLGLHCQIGEIYLSTGRFDEAARAFRKELQQNSDDPQARTGMGKIALENSDFEHAAEQLLQSAALREVDPDTHFHLAKALCGLGKKRDALRAVERSLRQQPDFVEAEALREELLAANS